MPQDMSQCNLRASLVNIPSLVQEISLFQGNCNICKLAVDLGNGVNDSQSIQNRANSWDCPQGLAGIKPNIQDMHHFS